MTGISLEPKKYKRGKPKKYNCRRIHKVNGKCLYDEEYKTAGVIYKVICKYCNDYYIGKTQGILKRRCQRYYQDFGKLLKKRKVFDTQIGLINNNYNTSTINSLHLGSMVIQNPNVN